ncbi:helix-turn-helix domain-containing protein [Salicibibacter cibarius]|uniref:helix-turn-helix domain-containing protein n=1 Tax=Salicibibacter cibarius TaxID=2743000 RepID=UPI0031B6209D
MAKSYLSSLERSLQSNPSIDPVQKIADVLGVSLETLIVEHQPITDEPLDPEWLKLAQEAMNSGISKPKGLH